MTLQGRTAVVTGGTRGIGRAITARLLHEGVSVAICGRSSAAVAKAITDLERPGTGKICGTQADVSNLDDAHRLFAFADVELGGVDILVNNAGVAILRSVAEMEPGDWQRNHRYELERHFLLLPGGINTVPAAWNGIHYQHR
jgi:3-oxoacyl-[acyl-carrier protein] reductase